MRKKAPDKSENSASTLKKGLSILSCFSWTKSQLTLTEIAQELNFSLPTAFRLAKALEEEGFLDRDIKTKSYRLGFKCFLLGSIAKQHEVLRNTILPYMEALKMQFNETVNLYIREGDVRICYEQVESSFNLKRSSKLGARIPLWAGAAGRCFLAFMPKEEVDRLLDCTERVTENTIMDREVARKKIREVLKKGYALSVSEREHGVSSIAAPIFGVQTQPLACMTISGPTARFTDEVSRTIALALREICLSISLKLGAEHENIQFLEQA